MADNQEKATAAAEQTPKIASTFGSHLQPILLTIKATPQQSKQITEVVDEFRPKIEPLRFKYKVAQRGFLDSMMNGNSAEELVMKQAELTQLSSRMSNEYCLMHLRIRKFLNETQCREYEKYRHQQGWKSK